MLWACLRFPDFALQLRLRGAQTSGPVIVTTGGNRPQILSCNPPARSHGIRPGMTASAAVALAPDLMEHVRDPAAEAQALRSVAAWAGQFTSVACLAPPDAVLLEIAGSLRLFEGLHPLLMQIDTGLVDLGYTAALAAAPTPTGAYLLARAGTGARIVDPVRLPAALAPLPLVLLDQPEEITRTLAAMGVLTLGECLALPRAGLARRFGQPLLDELDRALGRLPDVREPHIQPPHYASQLALPAPVQEIEPLLFAAKRLLLELAGFLRTQQTGVTRLELALRHEDCKPTVVMLGFAVPCRDAERMLRLLRERLARVALPDRVEAIAVAGRETRPLHSRNLSLFPEDRLPEEQRWLIVEHLRARLGWDAVHGIVAQPDHRPERASRACEPGTDAASDASSGRPLWLLEAPWQLPVKKEETQPDASLTLILSSPLGREQPGALTMLAGPERIESGWWDDDDTARDYFVAVDAAGRKLWVFRERHGEKQWYLHGLFG